MMRNSYCIFFFYMHLVATTLLVVKLASRANLPQPQVLLSLHGYLRADL